jgi:hypothetical protein
MGFVPTHLFGTVVTAACRLWSSCREKESFSTWLDQMISLKSHPCLGKIHAIRISGKFHASESACFNLKNLPETASEFFLL